MSHCRTPLRVLLVGGPLAGLIPCLLLPYKYTLNLSLYGGDPYWSSASIFSLLEDFYPYGVLLMVPFLVLLLPTTVMIELLCLRSGSKPFKVLGIVQASVAFVLLSLAVLLLRFDVFVVETRFTAVFFIVVAVVLASVVLSFIFVCTDLTEAIKKRVFGRASAGPIQSQGS